MLKIAICDDKPDELSKLQSCLDEYLSSRHSGNAQVHVFSNALNLLEFCDKNGSFDIMLLDIFMPGMTGLEVSHELRQKGDTAKIIFLTTSKEHAIEAFSVRAYDYILKPIDKKNLFASLDELMPQFENKSLQVFRLKGRDGVTAVPLSEIVAVELEKRCMQVYLINGTTMESTTLRSSFEDATAELIAKENFIQTHKSYIINMRYASTLKQAGFSMRNNMEIPVARRFAPQVKKEYMSYLLKGGL